jgi:hypothetical protein
MLEGFGEPGLDPCANFLLDTVEYLAIEQRGCRQRNDDRQREAPLEEKPAAVDKTLGNGSGSFSGWSASIPCALASTGVF